MFNLPIQKNEDTLAIPIILIDKNTFAESRDKLGTFTKNWLETKDFEAANGSHCLIPDLNGHIQQVFVGVDLDQPLWSMGSLSLILPQAVYYIESYPDKCSLFSCCLGWILGSYQFSRYLTEIKPMANLICPKTVEYDELVHCSEAVFLVRDLVNTPAEDMNPAALEEMVFSIADSNDARVQSIIGEQLLTKNFPAVYAVGRAAQSPPRITELVWGDSNHPHITLIGKGVCFDTGGLNLKPDAGMRMMKKDMGGAAHAIALAYWIMQEKLPIYLRLIVPIVENSIDAMSYRPGDIINTRMGKTVEIGNTDAEGRLVLADALTWADEQENDLIIDFATLTGAARIALGTDVPGLFCRDKKMARHICDQSDLIEDSLWHMPLIDGYMSLLKSPIADISNMASSKFGGSITAALFLEQFLEDSSKWIPYRFNVI